MNLKRFVILAAVFSLAVSAVYADGEFDNAAASRAEAADILAEAELEGVSPEVAQYIRDFNAKPLWARSGNELQYPVSMKTLFSTGRTAPVKAEEYEHLSTTDLAPWLKVYHMTTEQQVYQGIKGGEYGQLIFTIAASPFDRKLLLLGNDTVGIYRSEDGGASWRHSSENLLSTAVNTLVFDPDDENVVYASTFGSVNRGRFGNVGVYKSEDKGKSWRMVCPMNNIKRSVGNLISIGPKNKEGNRPIIAASDDTTGWDTTGRGCTGLFRSWDKGETWEHLGYDDKRFFNLKSDPDTHTVIACIDGSGVLVSEDDGATWVVRGDELRPYNIQDVAVNPLNKQHWIAGATTYEMPGNLNFENFAAAGTLTYTSYDKGKAENAIFESFDSGRTWKKIDADFGRPELMESGEIRALMFSPVRADGKVRLFINFWHTTETVRFSDDYGRTFGFPDYHQEHAYFLKPWHGGYFAEALAHNPFDPETLYVGRGSTFRISTDGGENFYPSSSGYSGAAAYDWFFDKNGVLKYIGMIDTGMWRMAEGYEGDYIPVRDLPVNRPSSFGNGKCVTGIAADPNDDKHFIFTWGGGLYGNVQGLAETFDAFETQSLIDPVGAIIEREKAETGKIINCKFVRYHNKDANVIYSSNFISYDNAKTWAYSPMDIRAVCEADNDILYGTDYVGQTTQKRIYVSYDRGRSWNDSGIDIPTVGLMRPLISDVKERGVIWAAEFSQVFRIDLNTGKIKAMGAKNGVYTLSGKRMEIICMAQNPGNPNHLILGGRDFETSSVHLTLETWDGGDTWKPLAGMPLVVGSSAVKFHPTKSQVYLGTCMGTVVYDYGVRLKAEKAAREKNPNTDGGV